MGDLFIWLASFFILIALLVLVVYQLMCLADLEFDYINPYDSSSRINKVVLPEFITEGVLCVFFLITGHWFMSLLCVPYLYYNVRLYTQRQHLVDVTEIFNQLHWEKKQRLFKLAYLIFLLFLSIFWFFLYFFSSSRHSLHAVDCSHRCSHRATLPPSHHDIPMAQFIINMNASMPQSQKFIIHILDSTHLFVQPNMAEMIRSAIAEFRDQNSYEKPA
ncbi:hypothetical protein WN944_013684 [Citrus x changshan-huyou]|uniref:Uncharacterized protein n=1 Tax=Citrus x changshan-huyou TaxID=2935761 RepID=A0AAP0QKU9_9ROSI